MFSIPKYWAGTPESLHAYIEAVSKVLESDAIGKQADYIDPSEDPKDCPPLYQRQGQIGVVTIKGSLTNSDSWMNAYIGAVSYGQIREALIFAANDSEAKAIVLDIDSGGGAVAGMSDTADLVSTIDSKIKPVYAFSDSLMASAAYSLGVSARELTISKMAEVGSVGVLLVHREMSKMMEEAGVTTTVLRSGKWKALGNSMEPLSDSAKEVLQAQVDKLAGLFTDHVAACRKKSSAQVESTMGAGRVFIGSDAVDVGLVDAVANFDTFMAEKHRGIAFSGEMGQYPANSNKNLKGQASKTAITSQPPAANAPALEAAETEVAIEASHALEAPTAADSAVVALLQTQLATAQAQVLQLSVDLQTTKNSLASAEANAEKFRPVVRGSLSTMRIALGGAAAGIESLTDDNLMAEHANLSAQFNAKFPTGGVAAVSSSASSGSSSDDVADPLRQARLAATRNSK